MHRLAHFSVRRQFGTPYHLLMLLHLLTPVNTILRHLTPPHIPLIRSHIPLTQTHFMGYQTTTIGVDRLARFHYHPHLRPSFMRCYGLRNRQTVPRHSPYRHKALFPHNLLGTTEIRLGRRLARHHHRPYTHQVQARIRTTQIGLGGRLTRQHHHPHSHSNPAQIRTSATRLGRGQIRCHRRTYHHRSLVHILLHKAMPIILGHHIIRYHLPLYLHLYLLPKATPIRLGLLAFPHLPQRGRIHYKKFQVTTQTQKSSNVQ